MRIIVIECENVDAATLRSLPAILGTQSDSLRSGMAAAMLPPATRRHKRTPQGKGK
jgi:hypothetical protein